MTSHASVCSAIILSAAFIAACGPSIKAPKAPDGHLIQIEVLIDRSLEGKTDEKVQQLNQVGSYMEQNIMEKLAEVGYDPKLIQTREEFVAAPGKYLLFIKLTDYNPGSKAARVMVGFGAGTCSLDLHYELVGEGDAPLLSKEHGRASSWDWDKIVRKLNEDIIYAVTNTIETS